MAPAPGTADWDAVCDDARKTPPQGNARRFGEPPPDGRNARSRCSRAVRQPEDRCGSAIDRAILTPCILVSNTATLYSTVLYAKGITNDSVFIVRVMAALREFMEADGLAFTYDRFIMPRTGLIRFASTFSRSVTGSMNELIAFAQVLLADDEMSPFDLGFRLNDLLLSASRTDETRDYGKPRDAFRALIAQSSAP